MGNQFGVLFFCFRHTSILGLILAGTALNTGINNAGDTFSIGINGGSAVSFTLNAATIQSFIDTINTNTSLNELVQATFDDETGQITIRAIDSSVQTVQIGFTGNAANDALNIGFGTHSLVTGTAANAQIENLFLGAAAGELATLEEEYTNILAQIVQAQFPSSDAYWDYSRTALFDPIGVQTATLETDASGTWVGSSYLWASVGDWARLGELMLNDGQWDGQQVLPAGWLALAGTQALPDGEGAGYGAQTWIPANPVGGECKDTFGLPQDMVSMEGHWGQIVAMVPSRNAVIVRLGWTFNGEDAFDGCQFVSDVLQTLPEK